MPFLKTSVKSPQGVLIGFMFNRSKMFVKTINTMAQGFWDSLYIILGYIYFVYYLDSNWKILKNIFISVIISAENSTVELYFSRNERVAWVDQNTKTSWRFWQISTQMLEYGFELAKINILSKLQTRKFLFFKTLTQFM